MRFLCLVSLALLGCASHAAEFDSVEVRRNGGIYTVHARARIDANVSAVRAVVTDYNHMHWITGAVLKAETLDRPEPGVATVFVRSRACFSIFCKTIEQVQRADARDPERVVFVTLPGRGDLKQGRSEWLLKEIDAGHTALTWDMLMEPDFWIPPLIGPGLIESGLADEGRDMINGIEKLAKERESRR